MRCHAQVGLLSFPSQEGSFNKPYSDTTALLIDDEARTATGHFHS